MKPIGDKFKEVWTRMNISSLSEYSSDRVKYSALPSDHNLTGRNEVIGHIASKFKIFKDFQGTSTVVKSDELPSEFTLTLNFESLQPVTIYAVHQKNIFVVVCLEPRIVIFKVRFQVRCKSNKISNIKIFQNKIIECRKTA